MNGRASELLVATVWHCRHVPKPHAFRYPSFYLLIDLDDLQALNAAHWIVSVNRFNLISFHEKDHGPEGTLGLKQRICNQLADRFDGWRPSKIKLLAMPRCFGLVFNPLSVFYAYDADGDLGAIVYEVRNTFGEKHSYIFRTHSSPDMPPAHGCDKRFHVSPFFPVEGRYEFRHRLTDTSLAVAIRYLGPDGSRLFDAGLNALRRPVSSTSLLAQIIRMPLASVGVLAAIHFEALKLWLKRIPVFTWPGKAAARVSFHLTSKSGGQ